MGSEMCIRDSYYTTVSGSRAATQAIAALQRDMLGVRTLQDFISDIAG